MAKKFVRGITDVKTINNQDFDTNNVNDLLSDGQYNYIHRKKGKNEEYHNLTDNIKTLSSDNTELLSVTNYNKTTNTATLHPKHDKQKEQLLESTRDTITINHGTNGTDEKTTVDTNPQKVLEHENLLTDYGISKKISGNTTKLGLEYTRVEPGFDLNNLENGCVRCGEFVNSPKEQTWFYVSSFGDYNFTIQEATELFTPNTTFIRLRYNGVWGEWREQVGDKSVIDALLSQKQDVLTAGTGITIQGNTISASGGGGGETSSFKLFAQQHESTYFEVYKHTITQPFSNGVTSGRLTCTTYTFHGGGSEAEIVLTGELKEDIEPFIRNLVNSVGTSNGALTITNDGTNIKLMNSKSTEQVFQQATFTFYSFIPDGGNTGGGGSIIK